MEAHRFDTLARSLSDARSRRRVLAAAMGSLVTLGTLTADAKKKKRQKSKPKKPLLFNEFGCIDVGGACRGKDALCCSGICQGKKPKKGKKDTRKCVAHNTGGCTLARNFCAGGIPGARCNPANEFALCTATTGNAAFCANASGSSNAANCRPCVTDKDCEAQGFGLGSACLIFRSSALCSNGCEGTNGSSGTACLPPGA
jgi:hypothetical protein